MTVSSLANATPHFGQLRFKSVPKAQLDSVRREFRRRFKSIGQEIQDELSRYMKESRVRNHFDKLTPQRHLTVKIKVTRAGTAFIFNEGKDHVVFTSRPTDSHQLRENLKQNKPCVLEFLTEKIRHVMATPPTPPRQAEFDFLERSARQRGC